MPREIREPAVFTDASDVAAVAVSKEVDNLETRAGHIPKACGSTRFNGAKLLSSSLCGALSSLTCCRLSLTRAALFGRDRLYCLMDPGVRVEKNYVCSAGSWSSMLCSMWSQARVNCQVMVMSFRVALGDSRSTKPSSLPVGPCASTHWL